MKDLLYSCLLSACLPSGSSDTLLTFGNHLYLYTCDQGPTLHCACVLRCHVTFYLRPKTYAYRVPTTNGDLRPTLSGLSKVVVVQRQMQSYCVWLSSAGQVSSYKVFHTTNSYRRHSAWVLHGTKFAIVHSLSESKWLFGNMNIHEH